MPPKAAWYCPTIRPPVQDVEPWCGFSYKMAPGGFPAPFRFIGQISLLGRLIEVHFFAGLLRAALAGLVYLALWALLPRPLMEPGGYVFDPLLTWFVATVVGGSVCHYFKLPGLVGILWAAAVWGNIPTAGHLTAGIVPQIRSIAGRVGLTVIVSRAGFAVSFPQVKKMWKSVLLLSFVPLVLETVAHALLAKALFNFPDYRWAFLQGVLTSAIAPGVVVPPLLGLREEGFGHTGPTGLMLSAVVFDSCGAIWAITFFADLIFSDRSVGLAVALGPIQLIVGLGIGALLGLILHFVVKIFVAESTPQRKSGEVVHHDDLAFPAPHMEGVRIKLLLLYSGTALALVFGGSRAQLSGGGAIAVLGFSAVISNLWVATPRDPLPDPVSPTSPSPGNPISAVSTQVEERKEGAEDEQEMSEPTRALDDSAAQPITNEFESSDVVTNVDHNTETGSTPQDAPRAISSCPEVIEDTPPPPAQTERLPPALDPSSVPYQRAMEEALLGLKVLLLGDYAFLWDSIVMPFLFSMTLSKIVFSDVFDGAFIGKALAVLAVGVAVRLIFACLCSLGNGYSLKEMAFVGLGWIGKAAVQAALGGLALEMARDASPPSAEDIANAQIVNNMAMLSAIFCAPLSAVCVVVFGRMWLPRKEE